MIRDAVIDNNASVKRKEWLDMIRAIGVLFIIFGHYYDKSPSYFIYTSPIKVPLLFAISGYVFSTQEGDFVKFFKKILVKLIIPWIALTWIPELLGCLAGLSNKTVKQVLHVAISGQTMWYFPCLIYAEIIFFFVVKLCKKIEIVCIVCVLLAICGYVLSKTDVLTFGMINRALVVQYFILIGYALRHKHPELKASYIIGMFILYLILCTISLLCYPSQVMDVHANRYYNIPTCILLIVIGCGSSFLLAEKIGKAPMFLVFSGQNTLILWTMNGYFLFVLNAALKLFHKSLPDNLTTAIFKFIYVWVACSILSVIVNLFLPEIVGKKRNKNSFRLFLSKKSL